MSSVIPRISHTALGFRGPNHSKPQKSLKNGEEGICLKALTEFGKDFFGVNRKNFNRSDVDSLRNFQKTLLNIESSNPSWLSRKPALREIQISRIQQMANQINILINEIKFKFPFPDSIRDLILDYDPDLRKELGLLPVTMNQKRVRGIESSQVKALGRKYGTPEKLTEEERKELTLFFQYASIEQRRQFFYGFFEVGTLCDPMKYSQMKAKGKSIVELLPVELETLYLTLAEKDFFDLWVYILGQIAERCPHLKVFHLSHSHLKAASLCSCYEHLQNFEEFGIRDCTWNCSVDEEQWFFESLFKLKKMDLRGTNISQETIQLIRNAKRLQNVQVLIENG